VGEGGVFIAGFEPVVSTISDAGVVLVCDGETPVEFELHATMTITKKIHTKNKKYLRRETYNIALYSAFRIVRKSYQSYEDCQALHLTTNLSDIKLIQ
jgi:hypothetical protein